MNSYTKKSWGLHFSWKSLFEKKKVSPMYIARGILLVMLGGAIWGLDQIKLHPAPAFWPLISHSTSMGFMEWSLGPLVWIAIIVAGFIALLLAIMLIVVMVDLFKLLLCTAFPGYKPTGMFIPIQGRIMQ